MKIPNIITFHTVVKWQQSNIISCCQVQHKLSLFHKIFGAYMGFSSKQKITQCII